VTKSAPNPVGARARTRLLRAALVLVAAGCGGPQKLGDAGATCFRDDDCNAGFICVAPTADDIHRVCSTDPTPLISMVMGPDYGGMNMGGSAGSGGGGATTAGAAGTPAGGAASGGGGATSAGAGAANGGNATAGTASTGGKAGSASGGAAGTAAGGTTTAGSAGTDAMGGAP
jgi:hypothetical protein